MTAVTGTATAGAQGIGHDRELRFKDRATRLAVTVAGRALADAGLLRDGALTVPGTDTGVVVSSNLATLETVRRVARTLDREGPAALRAVDLPNACSNAPASGVAIRYGLHGINLMLCNGATSGLDAVGWAVLALEAGRARHMLVVGVEPADAAAGTTDGAAALVLEPPAVAARRAAPVRAVVLGHARRRDRAAAVAAAGRPTPAGTAGVRTGGAPEHLPADGRDGPSGAHGVFQCVAATARFAPGAEGGAPPSVLVVAGGGGADDAAAAVLLAAAHHDGLSKGEG
ncbi:beta-ketoacyl synthase N-terminal-like domain-containing protein [Streptomyces caatingaensis]|uniref:Beta-ketoacyl synthase-like N-terminal domain-containing protein n=1 Tax=Streptomyces caatingaensis TaxID=1678637 RepID=A0A0K9XIH3_9ACTN|nr:beta-ketoacyl synthase N-terminal-like domain-containing protein [Streptomyces caatingaensis]KNB53179.1 hypothetical protein AC230_06900 [Streptomyces caatingaensis]